MKRNIAETSIEAHSLNPDEKKRQLFRVFKYLFDRQAQGFAAPSYEEMGLALKLKPTTVSGRLNEIMCGTKGYYFQGCTWFARQSGHTKSAQGVTVRTWAIDTEANPIDYAAEAERLKGIIKAAARELREIDLAQFREIATLFDQPQNEQAQ